VSNAIGRRESQPRQKQRGRPSPGELLQGVSRVWAGVFDGDWSTSGMGKQK
jgi:hypothetical protein